MIYEYEHADQKVYFGGKLVGVIYGKSYIAFKEKDKHFFRNFNGYGVSKAILEKMKEMKIVNIIFRDEFAEYCISIERLEKEGQVWNNTKDDIQLIMNVDACTKI